MKAIAVSILGLLVLGVSCTSARYIGGDLDDGSNISFGPKGDGEEFIRFIDEERREHYFLAGLIPAQEKQSLQNIVELRKNERLVNLQLTNEQSIIDGIAGLVGCVFTGCIVYPLIWQTRTTRIKGELVRMK